MESNRLIWGAAGATGVVAALCLSLVYWRAEALPPQEVERRLADLEARQNLPAGGQVPEAGPSDLGPRLGELERRVDELTRTGSTGGTPAEEPGETGRDTSVRPPTDAAAATERAAKIWNGLAAEDRKALIALVREAQKQIRQEEVWGWAAGIQASFVKSLREKLQLTPGQEDRVSAVLKVYLPEMNKVWHSEEGTPEERAEKSKELWAKVDGEVGATLTGEQAIAYEAWRKEQAEKAKKHSESGGK